ncbi:MAG TPA: biotin--[acetyl-CoA-carboxylase] ligase, partial [Candidatus Nitrosocosmicus sp.]|nr:biotin--[acetyl-CoA-carboxylase] ligase [Candidatus Nitrosocosmicus sp.]
MRHSKNDFVFRNFYFFESLGSTQDFAIDLISKSNILEPSVIICDIQSGGRGRKGSAWASPKGGIWMSIIFEPNLKINQLFFNVIITSLLLCSIIKSYINKSVQIKWPNDILVNKKKIAGILMDAQIQNENIKKIILGVGVNANNDIEETTYQIRLSNSTNYEITTIKHERLGISINETELVAKFLYGLSDYYLKLKEVSFRNEILSKYKRMIEESSKNQQYTFTS